MLNAADFVSPIFDTGNSILRFTIMDKVPKNEALAFHSLVGFFL